jgi:carlactone synthase/all-trans-10'-apo-beta-carotenal 13,14-cleaving dioxygenase
VWELGDDDGALDHLLDGYAMLVRVSFRRGRATGAHRQLESDAYKAAREHGRPLLREFGHCPKPPASLLDRVRNVVGLVTGETLTDNANVTVLPLGDDGRVMCFTETTRGSILIDPHTLGTIGRFRYADVLGVMNKLQPAHPIVTSSGFWTLLPDLVRSGYLLVKMAAGSNERKVVGRVVCRGGPTPGWVHSFAVTENYVVVPEMPLRYSTSSMIRSEPSQFYLFDWLPASGSYMHIVRKSTGKTVSANIFDPADERNLPASRTWISWRSCRWLALRCHLPWQLTSSTRTRRSVRTGRQPLSSSTAASTTLILRSSTHLPSTS